MTQSFLFALVVVAILLVIVMRRGIPEKFFVVTEPESKVIMTQMADPVEFARVNITDYTPVDDSQEYVF